MTDLVNSGNGGANGVNVTLANSSGGGSPLSHTIAGGATDAAAGNASLVYSNDIASVGLPIAMRFALNGTNPGYVRWDDSQTGTRFTIERDFYVPASVAANYIVLDMRSSAGVMATIIIGTDKKLYITNPTNTVITASASPALTSGTRVRVRMAVTKESATGAGDGVVELVVHAADYTTLLHSYTKTAATTTPNNPSQYRFADSNPKTSFTYDYLAVMAAGPRVSGWTPISPTAGVSSAAQNVGTASTASLSISAVSPFGTPTVATTVMRYSAGAAPAAVTVTGGATTSPSWTTGAPGTVDVATVTVTDSIGQVATTTAEVRVVKSGAFGVLIGLLADTSGWTNVGGAASITAAVADTSDTTYAESPDYAVSESELRFRLEPITARAVISLKPRSQVSATGGVTKFRLYNGPTLLQEWTITQSTSVVEDTFAVTDPTSIPAGAPLAVAWASKS